MPGCHQSSELKHTVLILTITYINSFIVVEGRKISDNRRSNSHRTVYDDVRCRVVVVVEKVVLEVASCCCWLALVPFFLIIFSTSRHTCMTTGISYLQYNLLTSIHTCGHSATC